MARRTRTYTVSDGGRDDGKAFLLTELPAMQAERWATRAMLAMNRGGADIPEDVIARGMAGLLTSQNQAAMVGSMSGLLSGLLRGLNWAEAEPLLDEMLTCVKIVESPSVTRPLTQDDIEEVKTYAMLRREVLDLHTGFFSFVDRLKESQQQADPNKQNTSTFPQASEPSSLQNSPQS